jgi:signal peptide peptidase SppA
MHITDIITAPWAILPDKLREIQAFYSAHARGEKINIAAIEARIGKPLMSVDQGYQNVGGVAVIPVSGVIGKKMNMMSQISGGASTQLIERDIKAALSDAEINSILLHIDSPGGTVDGTQTLADVVTMAKEYKPVMAFADGLMASAAYWIGSAASEIVSSSVTTQVGSIGVVTSHTDISKAEEQAGYKVTEISAGKYKRMTSQHAPLSKEGKALLQDQVDQLYTIFVDAVAINRGTDAETVLEDMADGRVFLSSDAQARGMIDHIATIETTILNMQTGVWPMATKKAEEAQAEPVAQIQEVIKLDITAIKEQYPDIVSELQAEGAELERARIADCESVALSGHEAIVNAMKLDGKSTGSDVARAIITAEKNLQASHAKAFVENAPAVIASAPVSGFEVAAEDDKSLPIEDRAKAKWDSNPGLQKEYASFKGFLAVMKKEESGKLRISGTQH